MIVDYKIFEKEFIDKFLHKGFQHTNNIIEPLKDDYLKSFLYSYDIDDDIRKDINSYFKKHKLDSIVLYHGTHPRNNILEEGLLKTTTKRRLSYQSTSGFVYLSIFPDKAKMYSDIGYGISNSIIYKITIPIEYIKPDLDNLYNKTIVGYDVKETLADSLIFTHTFRVAGNIPPYMIEEYKINEAYLSKSDYERRERAAANRMYQNSLNTNLTEEQHHTLSKLCEIRHEFHSNMDRVAKSDDSNIKKDIVKINIRLREVGLETMNFVPEYNEDYIDIDIDTIEELYEIEQVPEDDNEKQKWYDDNYERIYNELSELHENIEKYLSEIDKKYGTNYCPTGSLRIY